MENSDIKNFLKAKRGIAVAKVISVFLLLFVFAFPFYDQLGITDYLTILAPALIMVIIGQIWFGFNGVSQQELVNIIQRQIARDPETLRKLSNHDT